LHPLDEPPNPQFRGQVRETFPKEFLLAAFKETCLAKGFFLSVVLHRLLGEFSLLL
jgi:hypothetical protein